MEIVHLLQILRILQWDELKFNMILSRKDFNWSMTVNASTIENKLLNYSQEEIINGWLKVGKSLFDY
jgi:hypothetical protein